MSKCLGNFGLRMGFSPPSCTLSDGDGSVGFLGDVCCARTMDMYSLRGRRL